MESIIILLIVAALSFMAATATFEIKTLLLSVSIRLVLEVAQRTLMYAIVERPWSFDLLIYGTYLGLVVLCFVFGVMKKDLKRIFY